MTGNVLRQSMRLVTADHLQEVGEANGFAMSLKPFDVAKDLVQQMSEHAKTMDMCRTLSDRRPRSQRRKSKRGRVNATVHVCTVALVRACMRAGVHMCMCASLHMCMCAVVHGAWVHVCVGASVCVCVCVCVCMCACMRVCLRACVHAFVFISA